MKKMKKMKNLNCAISDDADEKLSAIMENRGFKNRADAVDAIIKEAWERGK